jgi:L-lactate dehydrogenase complex protein LldG
MKSHVDNNVGNGGARTRILGRIDAALKSRERLPHPGSFPGHAGQGPALAEAADRFAESLRRSGGEAQRFRRVAEASAWLQQFAADFSSAAVAPQVPEALRPRLPNAEPRAAQLGVSVALAAAAFTGSLLLDSREGRGLQLLPPVHLVWIPAVDIHPDLESALEQARETGPLPAVLALHSGPSKSADIGRILVTGVHGPGRLVAVVVDELLEETSAPGPA